MAQIDNVKYMNATESQSVKGDSGAVYGIVVNSHTSGTMKLIDGFSNGAAATTVLTSSGALVAADYSTMTLTSDATNVSDGETVTLNSTVYRFKTTPAQAYDVTIGASASATLDNLKAAVNGTGTNGVEYYIGTLAHTTIIATTKTATTIVFRARTLGVNAYATTETSAHLSFAGATMTGGVVDSASTFTIGDNTYTAVLTLSDTIGITSVANQVLWVTSEAVFLDNVKSAINCSGIGGTDYSVATRPHPQVIATTNTNTQQTFVTRETGTFGNSIATTETLANYAFTSTVMASGTGSRSRVIMNTITFASGPNYISFPMGISFNTNLMVVVGGTIDYTIEYF